MKKILLVVGVIALFLSLATSAQAITVSATLTADNHYGLYYGQANGSGLTLVGRNEVGAAGSPGTYNWSKAETWNFSLGGGDHLYVLAWDDGGPQSWIGQFTNFPANGNTLLSNTTEWEYTIGGINSNPGISGPLPSLATVEGVISSATWNTPLASAPNGTSPWGTISGVSPSAKFIWGDTLASSSNSDSKYLIFRSVDGAVPEPASMLLLGTGLLGLVGLRRRK